MIYGGNILCPHYVSGCRLLCVILNDNKYCYFWDTISYYCAQSLTLKWSIEHADIIRSVGPYDQVISEKIHSTNEFSFISKGLCSPLHLLHVILFRHMYNTATTIHTYRIGLGYTHAKPFLHLWARNKWVNTSVAISQRGYPTQGLWKYEDKRNVSVLNDILK